MPVDVCFYVYKDIPIIKTIGKGLADTIIFTDLCPDYELWQELVQSKEVYIFDHQAQAGNIDLWIVSEKGAQPFNKKA